MKITGVNINTFGRKIPLFKHHPAFQLKCPVICIFRIVRAMFVFELFCAFCSGKIQLLTLAVKTNTQMAHFIER